MRYVTTLWVVITLISFASTSAQVPSAAPLAGAAPASQPASAIDPMQARVTKVSGKVQYAVTDATGTIGAWQDAKVGDLLPAGSRIRTRLRSHIILAFGDDSVVMIDRATLASIDQFHRSGDTKRVKLGLGHGAIRAGVAETTLRSDMTIETPTATLSKKGTIDFGMEYEPSTGRYRIYLSRQGLVEALNKITGQRMAVLPGQYVTEAMARWVETAMFDHHVEVSDAFSMTGSEQQFNVVNDSGIGVADPGGGANIAQLTPHTPAGVSSSSSQQSHPVVAPVSLGPRTITRTEGNFGTGNAKLPVLTGKK